MDPLAQPVSFERGLFRARRVIKQSNLLFISSSARGVQTATESILFNRAKLERYISRFPFFAFSLKPVEPEESAPRIVRLASDAASAAGVGPFAAVPGALADLAMEKMRQCGASVSLVENGGEIAAKSKIPLCVGVYAGASAASGRIGFHLDSDDFPIGIATSSASVGHALSLGEADAAVAIADTAALSDAFATAICNSVTGNDVEASVQAGLETAEMMPNLRGALVVREKYVGSVGRLPKLMRLRGETDAMFKASLYDIGMQDLVFL